MRVQDRAQTVDDVYLAHPGWCLRVGNVENVLCAAHAADQQRARLVDPQARQQECRNQRLAPYVLVAGMGPSVEHSRRLDKQRHLVDGEVRLDRGGDLQKQPRLAKPVGHLRRVVEDVRVIEHGVQRVDRTVQAPRPRGTGKTPAATVDARSPVPQLPQVGRVACLRRDPPAHVLRRGVVGCALAPVRDHMLLEQLLLLPGLVPLAERFAVLEVGMRELSDVQPWRQDAAGGRGGRVLRGHPHAALDLVDDVVELLACARLRPRRVVADRDLARLPIGSEARHPGNRHPISQGVRLEAPRERSSTSHDRT
jgi:hypothetical protein